VYGLTDAEFATVIDVLSSERTVDKAVLFGSRAMGTAKPGSDVDIALSGLKLDRPSLVALSYMLNEETFLPYTFDLVNISDIDNPDLKDHIERVGIVIYAKEVL